jgi:hypothetical protein
MTQLLVDVLGTDRAVVIMDQLTTEDDEWTDTDFSKELRSKLGELLYTTFSNLVQNRDRTTKEAHDILNMNIADENNPLHPSAPGSVCNIVSSSMVFYNLINPLQHNHILTLLRLLFK